jgi:hypothetical protein
LKPLAGTEQPFSMIDTFSAFGVIDGFGGRVFEFFFLALRPECL